MSAAQLPTDDPALTLCQQLDALLTQEVEIGRLWSAKESALRIPSPMDRAKAKQEFDEVEGLARQLDQQIERMFRVVDAVRATTIEGIAAKLRVTIRHGSPEEESAELPWPQIRSVLLDLEQLAANDNVATVED
jgi:hypothetical protein